MKKRYFKVEPYVYRDSENNNEPLSSSQILAKLNAFDGLVEALKQLSTCNLTEENCASFDVANRRIRNISSAALTLAKEVQCN